MSIIKVLFQSLLNEKKDEEIIDSEVVMGKKKIKKTSQIVNKLEKGNNGIFGDEYEDTEEDIEEDIEKDTENSKNENEESTEDEESSEDDNINFRDKDKEARQKYIESVKNKLKENDKQGNKSGNKNGNKNGSKNGNKSGNKNGNKDSKYGKVADKNLGKESHHIFTVLKNLKLQERLLRSRLRKAQRAVRRANILRRRLRAHRFLLASHKRYVARKGFLFKKIRGVLGNLIRKNKLMKLVAKRKLNLKKAKAISNKVKKAKKQLLIAKKLFKRARDNKEKSFKQMVEAQRKNVKVKKNAKRGIGF